MKKDSIGGLTLSLTDECNFHCTYCYQQGYSSHDSLDRSDLIRTIDFFHPYLARNAYVNFYGGEPLLKWNDIACAVEYMRQKPGCREKGLRYSLTTNGSLITPEIIEFLARHRFSVALSFDGVAQDIQRGQGSIDHAVEIVKGILATPQIEFSTNSVFTPETVGHLCASMEFIASLGVANATFALSYFQSWNERALTELARQLQKTTAFLRRCREKNGKVPVTNFRGGTSDKIFACFAGKDRMAVGADGTIWGCFMFHDFFKEKKGESEYRRFCFGTLGDYMKNCQTNHEEISRNYADLRQDHFHTEEAFCCECPLLHECRVCPVTSGLAGSPLLEKVPPVICRIQKIFSRAKREFLRLAS